MGFNGKPATGMVEHWYGNYKKAQQLIKWQPTTTVEEGLKKYAHWQKQINYKKIILPAFAVARKNK